MKHRRNKVKREHGIIENALEWLEDLSQLAEVTDIIPGVIDVNHSSGRGIVYKYETQTGCKLLLKSNGSIQEAFVVTPKPALVEEWVNRQFPTSPPVPADSPPAKPPKAALKKNQTTKFKSHAQGYRSGRSSRRRKHLPAGSAGKEEISLNFADHLDSSTRKALQQFKQSLQIKQRENIKAKDNEQKYR